ncbi:hypothetical protein [Pseudarthrobacter sp. H2]|uniref:hypothetical protein n=1 Tax=Pseudarthrobacter sp. H2 TaxID=3418415 RepID=UPI003CF0B73C
MSLTAGTVLHRTHTALHLWFWAAYLMTTGTPGISAVAAGTGEGKSLMFNGHLDTVTVAGLQAAREQGRVGGRKRITTEAKIRSARKLLNQGTPPGKWPTASASPCRRFTGGSRPQALLWLQRSRSCWLVQATSEKKMVGAEDY